MTGTEGTKVDPDWADLDTRFTHHPPTQAQAEFYVALRGTGHSLAKQVVSLCPLSRERSLALTKIEEAIMWANAAIARRS